MICCKCKKEIAEGDLFCRFCGARQSIAEPKKWNSLDAVKFDFEKYNNIPTIIQVEYRRLFSLLEEGQNYGAVLQMRDVYEICLKLPVIISMAYICSKERLSEAEYKVIDIMIERELSCGAWHEIARMLIKTVDQKVLVQILNEADELWSWDESRGIRGRRNKINGCTGFAHWRNSTIGHGALLYI